MIRKPVFPFATMLLLYSLSLSLSLSFRSRWANWVAGVICTLYFKVMNYRQQPTLHYIGLIFNSPRSQRLLLFHYLLADDWNGLLRLTTDVSVLEWHRHYWNINDVWIRLKAALKPQILAPLRVISLFSPGNVGFNFKSQNIIIFLPQTLNCIARAKKAVRSGVGRHVETIETKLSKTKQNV